MRSRLPLLLAASLFCPTLAALAAEPADPAVSAAIARARTAYEQNNCPDVVAALEPFSTADAAGSALDGASHYRLGYCLAAVRRVPPEPQYGIAAEKLAREAAAPGTPLDTHFYLVNSLLNLGRDAEGTAAAKQAVERWRAGTLVVPADDAQAWFRLGKLFRDSGDGKGALEPFGRALDIDERKPGSLRTEYVRRIADHASEQLEQGLLQRASAVLARRGAAAPAAPGGMVEARQLVAAGKFDEARPLLQQAAKGRGDEGMFAQYALGAIDRAGELPRWGLSAAAAPGGPTRDLRPALADAAKLGWETVRRARLVEVPRKKGEGTRASVLPDPELREAQARFTGLLLEAVRTNQPIREWAIADGYAPLIIRPWDSIVLEAHQAEREPQVLDLTHH
ncbi:MAG: hypothetical protein KBD01_07895 [Acidobacteria bacterium]|nr:hypothetical protein [Acidobacteriota bacterium]